MTVSLGMETTGTAVLEKLEELPSESSQVGSTKGNRSGCHTPGILAV
jgi:hypothetical protein